MWSLWKARPRAPGRGVLSPGEYGSAEKSGREVRQREIRYLKPAEAAAHILGKCKENVFNGRPVGRPPRPPTAAAARRQPLLLAASRVPAAAALDGPGGGRGGGCPHHTLGCHTALQRTLPICKRLYASLCVPRGYSVISPVQRACNRRRGMAHFAQQPTWRSTLSSPGSYSNMPIGGAQGPRQVVVLGMHHSGTSIVTKLLRDAGLYLGEDSELAWSKSNPLKYFERLDVNELNRLLLGGSDVARSRRHSRAPDWVHHGTDPQAILAGSATLRETALAEISRIVSMLDGPTGKRLWAIKASAGCPPLAPSLPAAPHRLMRAACTGPSTFTHSLVVDARAEGAALLDPHTRGAADGGIFRLKNDGDSTMETSARLLRE